MAGIHDWSRYREDPLGRLVGTVRWIVCVTFGSRGTTIGLDTTDRWPSGCSVRSAGAATIGPQGMPEIERWRFEGDCPLRDWAGEWRFSFATWQRCTTR